MTDEQGRAGDNSKAQAVEAANHLVDRLQDEVGAFLKPDASEADQDAAVEQMIGDLEASPEVAQIRTAGDQDPGKFGSSGNPGGKESRRIYDEADVGDAGEGLDDRRGQADFSKLGSDPVTGPVVRASR